MAPKSLTSAEVAECSPSIRELDYKDTSLALEPRQIRLLEILPDVDSQTIRCTLRTCRLDDKPIYDALSYHWGDPSRTSHVICNGARLDITANLDEALRQLRTDGDPKVLWVDAICVNQKDLDERTHQVALMRDVYQQARRTVVWLGEASVRSDSAIDTCEQFVRALYAREDAMNILSDFNNRNPYLPPSDTLKSLAAPSAKEALSLVSTFKRPWFRRIWVLQEAGVQEEVTMICGQKRTDFDRFMLGAYLIMGSSKHTRLIPVAPQIRASIFASMARGWSEEDSKDSETYRLLTLLRYTRTFESTDPRDKIFALFGLTGTDLPALDLKADYHLSTTEVYKNLAFALLRYTPHLETLETPRGTTQLREQLPSWVTDWSDSSDLGSSLTREEFGIFSPSNPRRHRALHVKIMKAQGVVGEAEINDRPHWDFTSKSAMHVNSRRSAFFASNGSTTPHPRLDDTGALCLSGHMIDKVRHVGQVVNELSFKSPDFEQASSNFALLLHATTFGLLHTLTSFLHDITSQLKVLLEWDDIAMKDPTRRYPTGETQLKAYWQTLCAGRYFGTVKEIEAEFVVSRKSFQAVRIANRMNIFGTVIGGFVALLLGASIAAIICGKSKSSARMMGPCVKRRLARTVNGYLGLVPRETRAGDIIALLQGGRLPFVLRSRGGPWELIGPCYIHGVMYGEAFDESQCGEVRLI